MQYVAFNLGKEKYAIEAIRVQSITENIRITKVPNAPKHIKGLINLRGSIKPVIDLNLLMDIEPNQNYKNMIIVSYGEDEIALHVEEVTEVLEINDEDIQSLDNKDEDYIKGVTNISEYILTFLEIDKILNL